MFNNKKAFFNKRLEGIIHATWDLEFQRYKSKEIREGFRFEYDKVIEIVELKKFFITLAETYGVDMANKIKALGPDEAHNALREGEEQAVAKKLGIAKLEKVKKLSKEDQELIENLKKDLEPLDNDAKQLESQIAAIDQQLDGVGGLNEKMTGLIELQKMLKTYITSL